MIVVDSNVLAARTLTSERSAIAAEVERKDPIWIVPCLWRYEFQNILVKAIWTKQLSPEAAVDVWRQVEETLSDNETDPEPEKALDLAGRYRITAYAATYVALAMEMGVLCVTEDRELQEKFPRLAVSMEAFMNADGANAMVRESRAGYRARRTRMTSVMSRISVLLICLLTMGGCVSGRVPALPAVHAPLSLQDCESVRLGMTEAEVYGLIGRPNHHVDSGIAYDIYDLPDSTSVWIAWQAGRVSWLFRQDGGGIRKPLNTEPRARGKAAQTKDLAQTSPFKASVAPLTTNDNYRISPGETIKLIFCIQNIATNTLILSRKCYTDFEWSAEPRRVISESIDKAGFVSRTIAPGGGSGMGFTRDAGIDYFMPGADEYAFLKPGAILRFEDRFSVPADYAAYAFTSITYRASIILKDDGRKYGLNAWTGSIDVKVCTIRLMQVGGQISQSTNVQYSLPTTGSEP